MPFFLSLKRGKSTTIKPLECNVCADCSYDFNHSFMRCFHCLIGYDYNTSETFYQAFKATTTYDATLYTDLKNASWIPLYSNTSTLPCSQTIGVGTDFVQCS